MKDAQTLICHERASLPNNFNTKLVTLSKQVVTNDKSPSHISEKQRYNYKSNTMFATQDYRKQDRKQLVPRSSNTTVIRTKIGASPLSLKLTERINQQPKHMNS